MNLKQILKIIILFIFLISIVFSFSIYYSIQNYRWALQKTNIATDMVLEVFQRKLLSDQYIALPSERSSGQWYVEQQKLKSILETNGAGFNTLEEIEQTKKITAGLDGSEEVFKQIVELGQIADATISASTAEKKTRLSTQLGIKAQEAISAASTLADINKRKVEQSLEQIIFLFSGAASLFFLMLIVSFWIIWKNATKLDQSNERFNFVSKATNDAIYDWDIVTGGLWFNEGFGKLFGYKKEDIKFELDWWSAQIHPEDREKIDRQINQILEGNEDLLELEYRFKKGDGSYAQVMDRAYLSRNGSGKAERYIGVMQDITVRMQYQTELKKRTEEAERLNKITVDRELKMIELKQQIAKLQSKEVEIKKNE